MTSWPEFEIELLQGALLRVDLYEHRYLAVGEYHNVVNHLLRSAAASCLADREADAEALVERAARRMIEWVGAARDGKVRVSSFSEFAATRGWLAVALGETGAAAAQAFVAMTAEIPAGPVHNARMAAALLAGDAQALHASARLAELSDAGLGLPWKRLALAVDARDELAALRALAMWIQEKMEATMTHDWGPYNEVPIEVSGAMGLAARSGLFLALDSNRVLTRFRG
jgi:hypothetical protein